jgi:hypothetical protein
MEKLQLFRGDTILIKVWFSDLRLLFQFFRVGVGYFVNYVGDLFEIWGYLRLKFVFHAYICIRACDVLCWVFRICELGVSFTSVISMCCWGCFRWSRVLVYWVYNIYIFYQILVKILYSWSVLLLKIQEVWTEAVYACRN